MNHHFLVTSNWLSADSRLSLWATFVSDRVVETLLVITCTDMTMVRKIQAGALLRAMFKTMVETTPKAKIIR